MKFKIVTGKRFEEALKLAKKEMQNKGWQVDTNLPGWYDREAVCFLAEIDGHYAGYAIENTTGGYETLIGVFKHPAIKTKVLPHIIKHAISNGAVRLDTYKNYAYEQYIAHGFQTYFTEAFDSRLAPKDWIPEYGVNHDIMYMILSK